MITQQTSPSYANGTDGGFFQPKVIANLVIYQLVWAACVLGAAAGMPRIGTFTALAAILWHLYQARRPLDELILVFLTGLVGGLWDSLLVVLGLIHYPTGAPMPWMAPVWIVALWMAFATTFNLCLRWLHGRRALASAFGLVGGPLAWWAGESLGALQFTHPVYALVALGLGWAVLVPVLLKLAAKFDGVPRESGILEPQRGLFAHPPSHRTRLRTTNGLERINRELKRRTRVASIFPNPASCLRLVSALLAECDEEWMSGKIYLDLNP